MTQLLSAVFIVLFASALCSGTEAALFSAPIIRVRQLAETNNPAAKSLLNIRNDMRRPIATIVILNNGANIGGSIVVGGIATSVLGSQWLGLFSGILTFMVIVFSEIIPIKSSMKPMNLRICARPAATATLSNVCEY